VPIHVAYGYHLKVKLRDNMNELATEDLLTYTTVPMHVDKGP